MLVVAMAVAAMSSAGKSVGTSGIAGVGGTDGGAGDVTRGGDKPPRPGKAGSNCCDLGEPGTSKPLNPQDCCR